MTEATKEQKPKERLSRTRVNRAAFAGYEPTTTRDLFILEQIYAHRFLDVNLLHHLLRIQPTAGASVVSSDITPHQAGFSLQALYKSLQKMYHAGYLNRYLLLDTPIGRGRGSAPSVYGLGPKSVKILPAHLGVDPSEIRQIIEQNSVKQPFLRHSLEVSRFKICLELACKQSEGAIQLLFWAQGRALYEPINVLDSHGEERTLSVYPDAIFAIQASKGRATYFLEFDRSSMPVRRARGRGTDLYSKFVAYKTYRTQNRIGQRYGYQLLPDGTVAGLTIHTDRVGEREQYGIESIPGFNVLFVVAGAVEQHIHTNKRIRNCLAELNGMGKSFATSSLFMFTTPHVYTVENPDSIFRRCWTVANVTRGLQSIIE